MSTLLEYLIEDIDDDSYDDILNEAYGLSIVMKWIEDDMPPVENQDTYDILASVLGDPFEARALTMFWRPDEPYFIITPGFKDRLTALYSSIKPPYHAKAEEDRGMMPGEYMVFFMRHVFRVYLDTERNTNNSYVQSVEDVFGDLASIRYEDILADYRRSLPRDYTLVLGDIELNVSLVDLLARYGFIIDMFQMNHEEIAGSGRIEVPDIAVESIANRLADIPTILYSWPEPDPNYITDNELVRLVENVIIDGEYISDDLDRQMQLMAINSPLGVVFGNESIIDKWKDNVLFKWEYIE